VLTKWKAPFTGGYKKTIPQGVRFVVASDPAPNAVAVPADVQGTEWERMLVDSADRENANYSGYYLVIGFENLRVNCQKMEAIGVIQTSWSNIRIVLYRKHDGSLQFFEESTRKDASGAEQVSIYHDSELYADLEEAKTAMIDYAVQAEDDQPPDPASIVILEPSKISP